MSKSFSIHTSQYKILKQFLQECVHFHSNFYVDLSELHNTYVYYGKQKMSSERTNSLISKKLFFKSLVWVVQTEFNKEIKKKKSKTIKIVGLSLKIYRLVYRIYEFSVLLRISDIFSSLKHFRKFDTFFQTEIS